MKTKQKFPVDTYVQFVGQYATVEFHVQEATYDPWRGWCYQRAGTCFWYTESSLKAIK